MTTMLVGSSVGAVSMTPIAAYVLTHLGSWHWVFATFSALILSCFFFGALMKPINLPEKNQSCLTSAHISRRSSALLPMNLPLEMPHKPDEFPTTLAPITEEVELEEDAISNIHIQG